MRHILSSIGYLNPGAIALLHEQVANGALILDIRLVAASRWRPAFSGKRLREQFGSAYQRLRELGNEHYTQPDAPIRLHDPDRGIPHLLSLLEKQDVCLLCRCQHLAQCHTAVVIAEVQRLDPSIQCLCLGEERTR